MEDRFVKVDLDSCHAVLETVVRDLRDRAIKESIVHYKDQPEWKAAVFIAAAIRFRRSPETQLALCIGWPTIDRLKKGEMVDFENGVHLIAADDLLFSGPCDD